LPGAPPLVSSTIRLPGSALPPGSSVEPVVFFARATGFLRPIVRGAFLQLVTFGLYQFWLTTDVRRHLWSHTSIAGDAMEYTGRGRELLIGFLLALAVLSPIYLGYFILGIEVERTRAFASLPLFVLFFVLAQFALYRARRYRLTRTIWRGVRFWMTGSGVSYAFRSSLWMLFVIFRWAPLILGEQRRLNATRSATRASAILRARSPRAAANCFGRPAGFEPFSSVRQLR
jgi:uncharacterized membrane protein YjgN (DUF898 family)